MLVLASASPRRRELLTQGGYQFTVHPAHINEDLLPGEEPIAYVTRLAREKAQAVLQELNSSASLLTGAPNDRSSSLGWKTGCSGDLQIPTLRTQSRSPVETEKSSQLAVLGADTTVTLDGHILGKPADAADAARMLRLLSGRTHRVITGVALATSAGTEVAAEVTGVRFLTLSDEEIVTYVATGEPMDKAGAYAIQGRAARWIPRIEGCYFNVVGLPLALVSQMLEAKGINSSE